LMQRKKCLRLFFSEKKMTCIGTVQKCKIDIG
jgi:hypothetical protein